MEIDTDKQYSSLEEVQQDYPYVVSLYQTLYVADYTNPYPSYPTKVIGYRLKGYYNFTLEVLTGKYKEQVHYKLERL